MDDGKQLDRADAPALPARKWISRVVPSQHDEGTVYVTQRGREDDDFGVYIYKSTDYGRTFTSLAANIPAGSVNVDSRGSDRSQRALSSAPISARSCRPTAGSGGTFSAATCRRCRSRICNTSRATRSSSSRPTAAACGRWTRRACARPTRSRDRAAGARLRMRCFGQLRRSHGSAAFPGERAAYYASCTP